MANPIINLNQSDLYFFLVLYPFKFYEMYIIDSPALQYENRMKVIIIIIISY